PGAELYDRFLAEVHEAAAESKAAGLRVADFLSPALDLLRKTIEPLPVEPATCFVAMPFARPYAGYFGRFYRPLLRELDQFALRAWGGLSGEEYVDLMLATIRRSGHLLADLSTLNPNVIYEIGRAHV